MLNELLLTFFLGMPAVAAMFLAREMATPFARVAMFWGGAMATGLAAVVLTPMLLCDGTMLTGYSACVGGEGLAAALTAWQPAIRGAAFLYVLGGPPLAILVYLYDLFASRRRGPAAR